MSYKILAHEFINAVNNYCEDTIIKMVREDYIQHNPFVPTGRLAFINFLKKLKVSEAKIENIRMFRDENFIVMQHKWRNVECLFGSPTVSAFHIIRFDEKAMIAEHWNIISKNILSEEGKLVSDNLITNQNKKIVLKRIKSLNRKQHAIFGEGNFVMSITEEKNIAKYDLFRLESGEIIDTWNISQKVPSEGRANENTMFGFDKYPETSHVKLLSS